MVVVGIDPGKKGGIACLFGEKLSVWPFSPKTLCTVLDSHRPDLVAVEQVHAMPGQGVTSMFTFGQGYGMILGICYHAGYKTDNGRLMLVTPQKWKTHYSLIGCPKTASIDLAMSLYQGEGFRPSQRARKPSDGMAEATLIANYAKTKIERGCLG
jgi:crossover junction endodeoxyribonuclease RuvC